MAAVLAMNPGHEAQALQQGQSPIDGHDADPAALAEGSRVDLLRKKSPLCPSQSARNGEAWPGPAQPLRS
jgi:hypothetical protein